MSTAQHTYEYVRFAREGDLNEKIKRGEIAGPLVYDFKVTLGGEHVATFLRYRNAYELHDRIGRPIVAPDRTWHKHIGERARTQALFGKTLAAVEIPTAKQCSAWQASERRRVAREKAAAQRRQQLERVRSAAPALLAVAEEMYALLLKGEVALTNGAGGGIWTLPDRFAAAIAKATRSA